MPITKKIETVTSIHVYHVPQLNINDKDMVDRKVFLAKRIETVTSIHVCHVPQLNINDKDMVDRKAFLANPKYQYHLSK